MPHADRGRGADQNQNKDEQQLQTQHAAQQGKELWAELLLIRGQVERAGHDNQAQRTDAERVVSSQSLGQKFLFVRRRGNPVGHRQQDDQHGDGAAHKNGHGQQVEPQGELFDHLAGC